MGVCDRLNAVSLLNIPEFQSEVSKRVCLQALQNEETVFLAQISSCCPPVSCNEQHAEQHLHTIHFFLH